jgi:hypothetical protein
MENQSTLLHYHCGAATGPDMAVSDYSPGMDRSPEPISRFLTFELYLATILVRKKQEKDAHWAVRYSVSTAICKISEPKFSQIKPGPGDLDCNFIVQIDLQNRETPVGYH